MKKNPVLMKATKGAPMQMNYDKSSPNKFIMPALRTAGTYVAKKLFPSAVSKGKNFMKNIDSMIYSPNPKKYHKKGDPPITGNIIYRTKGGDKTKIKVSEVTDKKGKTTLTSRAGTYDSASNIKDRSNIDAIINKMNKSIKKDKSFLQSLKDEFGNIVKRVDRGNR